MFEKLGDILFYNVDIVIANTDSDTVTFLVLIWIALM